MIRRPPRSTLSSSSAASDVYKRQVELLADTGGVPGRVECRGELGIGQLWADLASQRDRRRGGAPPLGDRAHPVDHDLFGRAGVPAQSDPQLTAGLTGAQRDIAEQGPQHPLAVSVTGGGGRPQGRQVSDRSGELLRWWQWRLGLPRGGERGFGLGELNKAVFPPGFQAARDQPVLRFARACLLYTSD